MQAVRQIIEKASTPLIIDIPTDFKDRRVEVIILPLEELHDQLKKYDFSDLTGKLKWKGDGLSEQRKLRDEWE